MKNFLTFLVALSAWGTSVQGQSYCVKGGVQRAIWTEASSKEDTTTLNGTYVIEFKLIAGDSITIDSIVTNGNSFTDSISIGSWTPNMINLDTQNVTVTVYYDSSELSFYPEQLLVQCYAHVLGGESLSLSEKFVTYFTPYNTIEIWTMNDFGSLPRSWYARTTPQPQRVYVPKDSIPSSTILSLDSNSEDWEYDFQVYSIDGLPYGVQMKALHPDTIETMIDSGGTVSSLLLLTGSLSGRLRGNVLRDWVGFDGAGAPTSINLPLSGIQVKLINRVGLVGGGSVDQVIGEAVTGLDGTYSINWSGAIGPGQQSLWLKFYSRNDEFNIKVVPEIFSNTTRFMTFLGTFSDEVSLNINNTPALDVIIPTTDPNRGFFLTTHWVENAYRFVKNEAGTSYVPGKILVNLFESGSFNFGPYMSLSTGDEIHENTIYHEFGHYLMYSLQGNTFLLSIAIASDHSSQSENNQNLALTEGWATGVMAMIDRYYHNLDGESGRDMASEGFNRQEHMEHRMPWWFNDNLGGNALRNEYFFSCAINDFFDGPNSTIDLPTPFNNGLPAADYQDPVNNQGGFNVGWISPELDNISLSASQLFQPFINNHGTTPLIGNQFEYFYELLEVVGYTDCETVKNLKMVYDQNRISTDVLTYRAPNGSVTSDEISTFASLVTPIGPFNVISLVHTLTVDENDITASEIHYNVGARLPEDIKHLSDNISVENGSLLIQDFSPLGWSGSSGNNPPANSTLNLNICADNVDVLQGGVLKLGDNSPSTTFADVSVLSGSVLSVAGSVSSPGRIIINDFSKLIIEEGATLRISPNSEIVLDGSNAILEIQGNLVLQENVEFKPIGGSNGQGYVIFDMNDVQNEDDAKQRIVVSNGSSMTFESTSQSNKVLEIKGQGLWIDDNGTDFEFKVNNGYVDIGEDAMLNLGCTAKFNGAMVQKTPGGGVYRGVYLWGHPDSEVKFSTFKEAATGLTYTSTKFGVRLNVLSTIFTENYTGLKTKGGGITIKNSFVDDNTGYGMFSEGVLIPSFAYSTSFSNNSYQGLSFGSNSAAKLSIIGCDIVNNPRGMVFISKNDLLIKCSNFTGISAGSSPFALDMYCGTLLMSDNFKSGYNFFGSNENNIRLDMMFGAPVININNGFNQFSSATGAGQGQLGIIGNTFIAPNTSSNQVLANIQADKNRWDATTNGTPSHTVNYNISDQWAHTMNFVDAFPLTYPNYSNATFNECLVNDMEAHRLFTNDGNSFPSEGTNVSTTTFTNVPISDVVDSIMHWSGDTTKTLNEIMDYWSEVLTFNEYPLPLNSIDAYYLDYASTQMLSVAGQYLADKGIVESGDINAPIIQDAFDGLGHLIDTLALADTSEPYSFDLKNQINLKKAHLYLTLDKLSDANNALNSMLSWADDATVEQANYWICQIGQFEYLNTHKYNYFVLDSFPTCGDTSILSPDKNGNLSSHKIKMKGDNSFVTVYPNPASNVLNVSFNGQESKYQYKLFDIVGNIIVNGTHDVSKSGTSKKLNIVGLPSATYYIEVQSGGNRYFEKIMIIR